MDIDNRISSGKKNYKYFIDYTYENEIELFTIIFPKTSTFVKSYDGGAIKWYFFFIIVDEQLLKKYNDISNIIRQKYEKRI